MAERKIIVMEDGKKIYEGPEQRQSQSRETKFLGLSNDTWVKLIIGAAAFVVFLVRQDETFKSVVETNKYLAKFATNSDNYHSAITGQQFQQGQPSGQPVPGWRRANFIQTAQAAESGVE